jgi:DNA-binding transcriptional regulator WhiA
LHKYFFRGWIDADGCLTRLLKNKYVVTVSGSYHQDWSEFKKISKKLGFKYKISKSIAKNGNKSSYVYIGGKESVMKFLKHVYSGLPIGLSRKSKIYKGLGE